MMVKKLNINIIQVNIFYIIILLKLFSSKYIFLYFKLKNKMKY